MDLTFNILKKVNTTYTNLDDFLPLYSLFILKICQNFLE